MSRDQVLLQGLRSKLLRWVAFIKRASYAKEVVFESLPTPGEFALIVRWLNKDGSDGEHRKEFTRSFVFGPTIKFSMAAWTVQRCVGDYARQIVQEVLRKRGV